MTSEQPLSDRCAAECRDGGYCTQYPVEGSERCRMHGGTAPRGEDNPSYKHGAYSKHMRSDLTEEEAQAYEDLVGALEDPDEALGTIRELAAEALLKYKRSGDQRFLREFRQLADTFNLAPNEDQLDVDHSGRIDGERTLGDEELAAIREGLAASEGDS